MVSRSLRMSRKQRGATMMESAAILIFTAVIALPGLRLVGELTKSSYLQANVEQETAFTSEFLYHTLVGGRPESGVNDNDLAGGEVYALQGGGTETNNNLAGVEGSEDCRPSVDLNAPCLTTGGTAGNRF